MNVHNRIAKVERALNVFDSTANPLPNEDRCHLIKVHVYQGRESEAEQYIESEEERITKELHDKYGNFDTNDLMFIVIESIDPKGHQFED